MTAQAMIVQVYEDIGEPTDKCPYTDPSDDSTFDVNEEGAQKILRVLNQSLVRIANWRYPDGSVVKIRGLYDRKYFKIGKVKTGLVRSATANTILVDVGTDLALGDDYKKYVVEVADGVAAGSTFLVVRTEDVSDGDGDHLRLHLAGSLETLPELGDSVDLKRNFAKLLMTSEFNVNEDEDVNLDPVEDIVDIIRIRDVNNGTDLEKTYRDDLMTGSLLTEGTPTEYRVISNEILFDAIPDEEIMMEMVFVKNPKELVLAGDIPEIPVQLHEAVMLWAIRAFQRNQQAFDKAYATKREVQEIMQSVKMQGFHENEMDNAGLVIYG